MDNATTRRVLGYAGREQRMKLKTHYGSPEKAEAAIREQMQDLETLESWGTAMNIEDNRNNQQAEVTRILGVEWKFDQLPALLRDDAIINMAAAYLAWQLDQGKQRYPLTSSADTSVAHNTPELEKLEV